MLPFAFTISPEGIEHATDMKEMLEELYYDQRVPHEIMSCIFLLKELAAGDKSKFAPYLDLLPPPRHKFSENFEKKMFPLY